MGYYSEHQPTYTVDVLGTTYSVYLDVDIKDDKYLEHCDGYCDKTIKRIVVAGASDESELANFAVYAKSNLRHEVIHAFLFESGLDGNSVWGHAEGQDHPEQVVEWFALQFPKLLKAFTQLDAL
jgi:hypothetical protein